LFWTDATIVLFWIASDSKKWKPFVSNRVEEIRKSAKSSQFGHCEGVDNPADLPSRGDCAKPKSSADLDVLQKSAVDAEECSDKHTVSL
jgi:hypothetical protein